MVEQLVTAILEPLATLTVLVGGFCVIAVLCNWRAVRVWFGARDGRNR